MPYIYDWYRQYNNDEYKNTTNDGLYNNYENDDREKDNITMMNDNEQVMTSHNILLNVISHTFTILNS